MSSVPYLKLKKRCLVYYSLAREKRYNEISKGNLKQFQGVESLEDLKTLVSLQSIEEVENVNDYADQYLREYERIKKKKFKTTLSRNQVKKISDSTNTFIDTIRFNYRKSLGLNQRMVTFVTLTLPENQKHTDKVLVKTLVQFIDHIKKVKNTLVANKVDTGVEIVRLENYVWRAETTEAGNIHFHLLFDCYVNHNTLKRVWNNYLTKLGYHGGENAANIHNLKNIKDVGGYVTKYLTKEPLNDTFAELLKSGKIKRDDLDLYDDSVKYRRPVLYVSWGSSRSLKTLGAPTFNGREVYEFHELKAKCEKVDLGDDLGEYVKIYKGKIYDLLNQCSSRLKKVVKQRFTDLYQWLYRKTEIERKLIEEMAWLDRLAKPSLDLQRIPVIQKNNREYVGYLFK